MKKELFFSFALAIATGLFIPFTYANAEQSNTLPYISSHHHFPPTRADRVRHTFEISNPQNSKQISQITIQVPEVVKWSKKTKDVAIVGRNGQKISADIAIKDNNIELNFPQTIAPGSELEIEIQNIPRVTQGNGPVYRLFAKLDGINAPMQIGVARFRYQ